MKKHIILSLFLLVIPFSLFPQWSYPVTNFTRQQYKAGSQSWQIRQGVNGWIYVANNKGLLEYNGQSWNRYVVPNDNVRSMMMVPGKRLYVGGIAEFGYFEADKSGRQQYHSISRNVIRQKGSFGNVWNIFQSDQVIYYQTDGVLIKQTGNAVSYIDAGMKLDCSVLFNGVIYTGTKKGLFMLLGNRFSMAKNCEQLVGKRIRSLIPLSANQLLIATSNDGLFIYENDSLKKFNTEIDTFIRENELFCCAVSPGFIAIGTIRNGVAILNRQGKAVTFSNMNNGLQDNTVLSMSFDLSENLWMGLNRGISTLRLSGALSTLYSSPNFYGVGYTAKLLGNHVYLGTNEGLYYTSWPIAVSPYSLKLNSISSLNGQVWDLNVIENKIFCSHDKGVFILNGDHIESSFDTGGAWSCKLSEKSDRVLIGCYSGMFVLWKQDGHWTKLSRIKGFYESTKFFEEDRYGVWVSHDQKGIIRLQLAADGVTLLRVKSYGFNEGLPSNQKVGIEKIGGKILFITPNGVYRYNGKRDRMEPDNGVGGFNKYFQPGIKRLAESFGNVWTLSESQLNLYTPQGRLCDNIKGGLELKEGYEMVYPLSGLSALIASEKGFYMAQFQKKQSAQANLFLKVNRVVLSRYDSLLYSASFGAEKMMPKISYRYNSLRFEFGVVDYLLSSGVEYSYKLEGYDDWSPWSHGTTKEYTALHEGEYTFKVKARTANGQVAVDEFVFRVRPPWYRSWWAYIIYLILLYVAGRYLVTLDKRRIRRHSRQIEARQQAELAAREEEFRRLEMEREKEIINLKSEQLESDLMHKSRELSNVMLNFVSKNEMLQDLKSDLLKISTAIPEQENVHMKKRLLALSGKIDQNMQHDEDWKKFEQNFDYVNNGFLQKLTDQYPELTYSERKMCVYLKMDLLSKEIASLLNISPRSVETVRYRLRKKFGMERDENLRDFLSKL